MWTGATNSLQILERAVDLSVGIVSCILKMTNIITAYGCRGDRKGSCAMTVSLNKNNTEKYGLKELKTTS